MANAKTKNTNCLDGLKCQKCGSLGPFRVESTCMATWDDDGIGATDGFDFSPDSFARCGECDATGTVHSLLQSEVSRDDNKEYAS